MCVILFVHVSWWFRSERGLVHSPLMKFRFGWSTQIRTRFETVMGSLLAINFFIYFFIVGGIKSKCIILILKNVVHAITLGVQISR